LASAFPQRLSLNLPKFFGAFFQKKNRLLCRLPSVEAISIAGQLQKSLASFLQKRRRFRLEMTKSSDGGAGG
jgi:hypothetical protein